MLKEIQNCFEDKPNWENYVKNLNLSEEDKLPDLFVNILPKCDWLIPVEIEISAPLEVEAIQKVYEAYYSSRPKTRIKGSHGIITMVESKPNLGILTLSIS